MNYREYATEFINEILSQKHVWRMEGVSDLPKGAYGLLTYLYYQNDGATVGELTEYLQVTSGRTAALLNRLEKNGFLYREQEQSDKRIYSCYLTETGRHQVEREYNRMVDLFTERFEMLGEEDAKAYVRILKKLHE